MGKQEDTDRAMRFAVYDGDVDALKELISKGGNPNSKHYPDEQPLLLCAAGFNKVEVIRYLLKDASIPIETCDKQGHTALLSASSRGSLDAAQYLVSAGANILARTALGETALHLSARTESVETFKFLQQLGIPMDALDIRGRTVLHHAAEFACPYMVKYILKGCWLPVDCQDKNGHTPMMLTADFPRSERDDINHSDWLAWGNGNIELLLDAGADLSIKDVLGRTALHRTLGNRENFGFLWEKCPDFTHSIDKKGQNPIHIALSTFRCHYDMPDIVKLLVEAGADVKSCDTEGKTPIQLATEQQCSRVVQTLIKAGVETSCYGEDLLTKILHISVMDEDFELTKKMLAEGADINGRYSVNKYTPSTEKGHTIICSGRCSGGMLYELSGYSPLFEAVRSVKMTRLLIDAGADVNFKDDHGLTPLQQALYTGSYEAMNMLLDAGADPNIVDDCGVSLLHTLASKSVYLKEIPKFIERLIQGDASVDAVDHEGRTPLHYAAKHGNWKSVKILLDARGDVNSVDLNGATPILMAAYHYYTKVVQLLLDAGADLTAHDKNGQRVIHRATLLGNTTAIDYLIDIWPSPWGCDNHGNTVLHLATRSCMEHILMRKLVAVDERNIEGQTPLAMLVQRGTKWTSVQHEVEILLAAGASSNTKDLQGKTPLHIASSVGDVKVMEVLIASGADVTSKDVTGRTPLHWAAQAHNVEGVQLLLLNRVSSDEQDSDGQTPLMLAVGSRDAVSLFLKEGANINLRDLSGKTILQKAVDHGNHGAVKLIWAAGSNFLDIPQESRIRAVHLAVKAGDMEMLDHLICLGMSLSDCWWDPEHKTTLLHCAVQSSVEMLKKLIDSGHMERAHDHEGHTALHCAVLSLNYTGTKYLLEEALVPVDERDANGRTALMLAASSELYDRDVYEMLEILMNAGADISVQDNDGKTVYQLAHRFRAEITTDLLDYMQHRL